MTMPRPDIHTPAKPPRGLRSYAVQPGWRLLMQDLGLRPADVLRRAQLPSDLFARTDANLDSQQYFSLWTALETEAQQLSNGAGTPVPLRVAQALSADWFDPVLFSALCSADLNGALGRVAKYKRLICPMALQVDITSRRTTLTLQWLDPIAIAPPVLVAFELSFFVQLARMATRSRIEPQLVSSPVRLEPASAYVSFFGRPVTRSASARLVFSADDASRPFMTANPGLWTFFEPALRQRLSELDQWATTVERLRGALLEALPAGGVSMQTLCHKLGLSSRTLQRRLKDEGSSFQQTLDSVRAELAQHYLKHSSMTGSEISFLLGFEDPNSFVRAFHGWTGTTPQTARSAATGLVS